MKKFNYILILFSISIFVFAFQGKQYEVVSGTVMHTESHCGGDELSPETEQRMHTPHPFPMQKLYVKKGKTNDFKSKTVLEFTSDADGKFSISLPPGSYCVVNAFKKDKKNFDSILKNHKAATQNYSAIDKACLEKWFASPDVIFTVYANSDNKLTITFHDKCAWDAIPCVQYNGPLPP